MSGWSPRRDLDEKVAEAVGNWRFEPVVGPVVDKRVNLANRRNSERAFSGIRQ
jgi:outer membrane biosynthesis protein TonB